MFAYILMIRRNGEAKQYLDLVGLPISLDECISVGYGNSAYLAITGFVIALIAGTFWMIHCKTLRGAIKLYVEETKYNLWCRM